MWKFIPISIILFFNVINAQVLLYERDVFFQTYVKSSGNVFNSTFNQSLVSQGCELDKNITFIIHGWNEGFFRTEWVRPLINNFLSVTPEGGCVIFMDYSFHSVDGDYFRLVSKYEALRNILIKKLIQVGNYDRMTLWGFSFGARLAMGVGTNLTSSNGNIPQISRMELCEPAGPGFDGTYRVVDPTRAAKNTACIATSNDKGTTNYNCHQNFRMGYCGWSQIAAGGYPKGSHGLCPYFYNYSFKNDFVEFNYYKCGVSSPSRAINATISRTMKMGIRNTVFARGEIFIMTARCPGYVVLNNNVTFIDNFNKTTGRCGPEFM